MVDDQQNPDVAKQATDKFGPFAGRFTAGLGDAPLLQGAAAIFECHTRHRNYGGDHIILIGNVERYTHNQRVPLVFHRGKYATVWNPGG